MQDHYMEYRQVQIDYGEDYDITVKIYCHKETSHEDAVMLAKSRLQTRLNGEVTPLTMLGVNLRVFDHQTRANKARQQG